MGSPLSLSLCAASSQTGKMPDETAGTSAAAPAQPTRKKRSPRVRKSPVMRKRAKGRCSTSLYRMALTTDKAMEEDLELLDMD